MLENLESILGPFKKITFLSVDIIAEIRIPKSPSESVVYSLSPRKQANDSLTSENTAKTTLHEDQSLGTPELKSSVEGQPKGSTRAKKKKVKETESKCTDSIVLEYSIRYNASQSVGGKVEYG